MSQLPRRGEQVESEDAAVAVRVRGGRHGYRRLPFEEAEAVLHGVDLTVRRGEVYALLGRSGCGKTTLLRALVGQHVLDDGEVLVFGRAPGDPESGVPGSAVGYMPQEVAVHDGFTIGETLSFHGRLVGMPLTAIRERTARLVAGLHLPSQGELVGVLSGGEKRRVSLCIALLHEPPLLILDEPTVGADPELRHSMWQLLLAVAAEGVAVVISTHYVEEARNAHKVGLLRRGHMAVEDSPAALLQRHRSGPDDGSLQWADLERAVQRLCALQDDEPRSADLPAGRPPQPRRQPGPAPPGGQPAGERCPVAPGRAPLQTRHKVAALLWKNGVYLYRHGLGIAAQALFFVFITVLACLVLGHWPEEVRVDVVNEEAACSGPRGPGWPLSCLIIDKMPERGLRPVLREDISAAVASVRSGSSWGVLHFRSNFSRALVDRIVYQDDSDDTLEQSEIGGALDTTDFVISNMIQRRLTEIVVDVVRHLNPSLSDLVKFDEPVFGRREPLNAETLMPGVLLGYLTTFAASLIMSTLLTEKMDKFMERTLVAGVRMSELMMCWVIVLLPVVLVVNLVTHVLVFGPLAIPCAGSTALVYLLCTVLCLMTMLAGLLFASVFDNYITAILACHQFAVSFLFLSGVLWPLQAMHWSLRWLALVMPWAYSMEAATSVLQRGWGLGHMQVWLGFASCAVWAALFLAGLAVAHRTPARGVKWYRVPYARSTESPARVSF